MEIKVTHTIELGPVAQAFLTTLFAAAETVAVATTPTKPPAANTGKKKDPPLADATPDAQDADPELVTFEMLKGRFAEKKAAGKNDALKKLMSDNGVGALSGLKEAQYKFFYDEAGKL